MTRWHGLFVRTGALTAPALTLGLGYIAILRLETRESAQVVSAFGFAHLIGSLPGIALGFLAISSKRAAQSLFGMLPLFAGVICAASVGAMFALSAAEVALVSLSLLGAYFDTFAKRFGPEWILRLRLGQAVVALSFLAISLLASLTSVDSEFFVLSRAAIAAVAVPFLVIVVRSTSVVPSHVGGREAIWRRFLLPYFWMAGSNAIFLAPILYLSLLAPTPETMYLAFALQTALQAAGRLSDYLTVSSLQREIVGRGELIVAGLAIFVVIASVLAPGHVAMAESQERALFSAGAVVALSGCALAWGVADSRVGVIAYRTGDFRPAFLSAVGGGMWMAPVLVLGGWVVSNAAGPMALLACLLGSALYALTSARRFHEV